MDNPNKKIPDEAFSTDPDENLRIENELLKLKMQAEHGAVFSESVSELSPELEAMFLENIQQLESAQKHSKETTVYEFIGKPVFMKPEELEPAALEDALAEITERLEANNIILHILGDYPPAVIYAFIINELFQQLVMPVKVPGFMQCFIYEEFHPNHSLSIERTVKRFLDNWFRMRFNDFALELAGDFITPEGLQFTREEVKARLNNCLDSYHSFSNCSITDAAIHFEWDDQMKKGLGHAGGVITYDATLENGETMHISGAYKLYMSCEFEFWDIYYFVMPGFAW